MGRGWDRLCRGNSLSVLRSSRGVVIRTIGIIPARYQSTRFPGKLLADLGGRAVLLHVLDRSRRAGLDEVVVATDDARIEAAVRGAGGRVVMPAGDFRSGTDRAAAALDMLARPGDDPEDVIVNVQGDEPFIEPDLIAAVARALAVDSEAAVFTAATPATPAERGDPNAVKVVVAQDGTALYFSRAPIPAAGPGHAGPREPATLRHIGLYAYRRAFLAQFVAWPPGVLEQAEGLEQLRALERGAVIRVVVRPTETFGIDTPADLERARERLARAT